MGRPKLTSRNHEIVAGWLAANGIDEWIPTEQGEPAKVVVDAAAGTITYRAFLWMAGKRGWNSDYWVYEGDSDMPGMEERVVPLLAPLTPDVVAAAEQTKDEMLLFVRGAA